MNITINNRPTEIPDTARTIADLADLQGLRPQGTAIARNGMVVKKSEWASSPIAEGDSITVISAAFGG